jgi:RecA-family ATPase
MHKPANQPSEQPFAFTFIEPFKTFHNGQPKAIPYVIDGLLTQGGLSALGGKSKYGKSSLTRYEAVCIAKGVPFLGRDTVQGDVILINLEDPLNHVDNSCPFSDMTRRQMLKSASWTSWLRL